MEIVLFSHKSIFSSKRTYHKNFDLAKKEPYKEYIENFNGLLYNFFGVPISNINP